MGVRDWVRRVEDEFFDGLETDESRQEMLALVSGVLLFVASLIYLFLGLTGDWVHLLPGGGFLVAAGLAFWNWKRIQNASGSALR